MGLLALAATLRIGAACYWHMRVAPPGRFVLGDSESYWDLASDLARGRPYAFPDERFRVFRAPGYPIVLAPLFWLWDEPPILAARWIGAMLGTLAVWEVGYLARRLCGPAAEWTAMAMAAVYPGAIAMSILVLSEAVFVPVFLLGVICWYHAREAHTRDRAAGWALAAGAAHGGAALTRPAWLLFALPAAVLVFRDGKRSWREAGRLAVCSCAGFLALMLPWWWRNAVVTGHFVPTTLQVGASLYDGLNPDADGGSDMAFADSFRARLERKLQAQGTAGAFEWQLDRAYRRAAWAWAREHPLHAWKLAVVKFWRTWGPWPHASFARSAGMQAVVAVGYVAILVLGMAGLVQGWHRGWFFRLPALWAVLVALLHVVFVGSIRYRQPVMIWWTVPAACAVGQWLERCTPEASQPDSEGGPKRGG